MYFSGFGFRRNGKFSKAGYGEMGFGKIGLNSEWNGSLKCDSNTAPIVEHTM